MRVRVKGWSDPRHIGVDHDGKVIFEVAIFGHCTTCTARVRSVTATLNGKQLPVEFRQNPTIGGVRHDGKQSFLVLDPPSDGIKLEDHIGSVLGLELVLLD